MNDNMFDVIPRCEATKTLKQVFDAIRAETDDGPYSIPDFLTEMERAINAIPSVDSEPVRHGEWLFVEYSKPDAWYCSECSVIVAKQSFYCPHCGAKMYGGVSSR